jgi:hypothetical protein
MARPQFWNGFLRIDYTNYPCCKATRASYTIGPARTFRRGCDVDHGGVERAVDHQRFGDVEHRSSMEETRS